jgi:hypothetical protein
MLKRRCWNTALHEVACVEEASKEPVQKIKDKAGMRKAEERIKEKETAVGVKKSRKTFSLKIDWKLIQRLHEVTCVKEACKEAVQKIKEKGGIRKAEERLKERKTTAGVEKRIEDLCMW